MALTYTTTTSPHAIRLHLTGLGADSVAITQAALVAACAAGPLKKFLQSITDDVTWTALTDDVRLTLTALPVSGLNTFRAVFGTDINGRELFVNLSAAGQLVVDIRFEHSSVR